MHARRIGLFLRLLRPQFLSITLVAFVIGVASAWHDGHRSGGSFAVAGLLLALLAHAAANVLNDHEDARHGTDAANRTAIAPFTGGSGLIQQGAVDLRQTRRVALTLLIVILCLGLVLALQTAPAVLGLGVAGLLLGWSYSAPPFAWMRRGWGEVAVALAWLGVVVGADALSRGSLSLQAAWLGSGFSLLVANILLVNGFPDADSDAATGKRTLRVRLGATGAAVASVFLVVTAHAISASALQRLHVVAWPAVLASLPLGLWASRLLWRHRREPSQLRLAIIATLATAHLHGLLLIAALLLR